MASAQEASAQAAGERLTAAEEHIALLEERKEAITGRREQFTALLDGLPPRRRTRRARSSRAAWTTPERRPGRPGGWTTDNPGSPRHGAALTESMDELRRTGGKFPKISGPVKDRVMHDSPDAPGRNAEGLAVQLRLRAGTLDGEFAAIAKDQGILAGSLAAVAR